MKISPVVFFLLLACGCSVIRTPDLEKVYALQTTDPAQVPVILIHGALGSRLFDGDREYWPGGLSKVAFSDYNALALEIDAETLQTRSTRLQVGQLTDRVAGRDFYGRIVRTLEEIGGYAKGVPGEIPLQTPVYYVYRYDWRADLVDSARGLHGLIEQIREDYASPRLQVDIIAHSMGGLITRYYARYGTQDVLDDNMFPVSQIGARNIRRAVLLGTPNLGSVGAVRTLDTGYRVVFGKIAPEVVATFPSTYQVLPHAINQWIVDEHGAPLTHDVFDVKFWREHGLSIFNPTVAARISARSGDVTGSLYEQFFEKSLERARRFTWSLTVPVPEPDLRYILFGSDCVSTPSSAMLISEKKGWRLHYGPMRKPVKGSVSVNKNLLLAPGDGSVTKASLLARHSADLSVARHRYSDFPLAYPVFLCEEHTGLTGNSNFQNNLLHALLSVD